MTFSSFWYRFSASASTSASPAAFDGADRVIVSGVYGADKLPPEERLDPERLVHAIAARGIDAVFEHTPEAVLGRLVADTAPGDVVVLMSNGGFGGLPERLVDALERRGSAR